MNNLDVCVVAGLLIGEGYIGVKKTGKNNFAPIITITNTDPTVIDYCREVLGGSIQTSKRGPFWKTVYVLHISHIKRVLFALKVLRPYLIGRKAQEADLAIAYCESRLKNGRSLGVGKGRGSITLEERDLIRKLKELKYLDTACSTFNKSQLEYWRKRKLRSPRTLYLHDLGWTLPKGPNMHYRSEEYQFWHMRQLLHIPIEGRERIFAMMSLDYFGKIGKGLLKETEA